MSFGEVLINAAQAANENFKVNDGDYVGEFNSRFFIKCREM